jgi:hypothetical protein
MKSSPLICLVLLLIGCAQEISRIDPLIVDQKIKFPIDNVTTKKEVIDRFGNPLESYEKGNILIYRVCEENQIIDLPNPKKRLQKCTIDLILVFNKNGILERHSLVKGSI